MGKNRLEAFSDGVLAIIITCCMPPNMCLVVYCGQICICCFGCRYFRLQPVGWAKNTLLPSQRRYMAWSC